MSARSHEEEITLLRSDLNELMLKENVLQEQLTSSNRQLAALQRSNQQSEEELQRAEAATDSVSKCKSQLEEVSILLFVCFFQKILDQKKQNTSSACYQLTSLPTGARLTERPPARRGAEQTFAPG